MKLELITKKVVGCKKLCLPTDNLCSPCSPNDPFNYSYHVCLGSMNRKGEFVCKPALCEPDRCNPETCDCEDCLNKEPIKDQENNIICSEITKDGNTNNNSGSNK